MNLHTHTEYKLYAYTYLCGFRGTRHKSLLKEILLSCGAEVSFGSRSFLFSLNILTEKKTRKYQPQYLALVEKEHIFDLS